MAEAILESWWQQEFAGAMSLASESDILQIEPHDDGVLHRLIAHFRCRGLVRADDGRIVEANHFVTGIWIPPDFLRRAETFEVLRLFWPRNAWHCNIKAPWICIGSLTPGASLADILYQLYEVFTWNKYSPHDGLNQEACSWARSAENRRLFPTDHRPLKRRRRLSALIETPQRREMSDGAES